MHLLFIHNVHTENRNAQSSYISRHIQFLVSIEKLIYVYIEKKISTTNYLSTGKVISSQCSPDSTNQLTEFS